MLGALGIELPRTRPSWNGEGGSSSGPSWRDTSGDSRLRGELLVVSAGGEEGVEARTVKVRVGGTFRSGYFDFDFGMAILPFSSGAGASVFPPASSSNTSTGSSSSDRYADAGFAERLRDDLASAGRVEAGAITTGLLRRARTEKTVMMLLIGLIFLVVGVNIFHSMRRAVAEKTEDIAVSRRWGPAPGALRRVFILDGLAIGAGGAVVGLTLGLLVAMNVNEVFALVEACVNAVAGLASG